MGFGIETCQRTGTHFEWQNQTKKHMKHTASIHDAGQGGKTLARIE
jgi:hypothetical protein